MTAHRTIDLKLKEDRPNNVYRYVKEWELVPSSHGPNVNYLLIHGVFQWGPRRNLPVKGYSIAIQYSSIPGMSVDVSQPPHIPENDIENVLSRFAGFVHRLTSHE